MLHRLLAAATVPLLVVLLFAGPATADEAVVVLDRGRAAKAEARRHERDALRLVEALRARAIDTRLVLYGTRPDGRIRTSRLEGDLEDRLARAATKQGWRYEAPTDPRHALEASVRRFDGEGPLLVFLVGPFAGSSPGAGASDEENDEAAAEALARWEEEAPPGPRVFALGLAPAGLARIAAARGVLSRGSVVLAAGAAVATPAPWSPLAASGPEAALEATVTVPLEVLQIGGGLEGPVLLAASSDGLGEVSAASAVEGGAITFTVRRPRADGESPPRVETLSFGAPDDPALLWLADPPQPRTIQWTTLGPDARVSWFEGREGLPRTPVDAARPLDADPLLVGRPLVRICRVESTRVGEAPVWRVSGPGGGLPDGMSVVVGDVVNLSESVACRDVEIRVEARPGEPGTTDGLLRIEAAGHSRRFEIPYRIVVPAGRVVARLEAPEEARRLPAGPDARPWTLVVEEESPNAARFVRVEAVLDPPTLASALTARLEGSGSVDVTWDLGSPLAIRPGRRYDLHLDFAPGVRAAEGAITLRLPEQRGVEGTAEGCGRVVTRSPRLVVAEGEWAYRMKGGEVVGDPPLVLEVDPDGGGGDWRVALFEVPPALTGAPGAPIAFALQAEGPGRWAVVPAGPWEGARGDTFSPRVETVPVGVTWSPGGVPDGLAIRIEVRPRWGAAGWILAGLAALALALGLWGVLQLEAAPVEGTLLYQVEGRKGTVGRLDLAPVGRRAASVRADPGGRLSLVSHRRRRGDRAEAVVVVVRPTRVGGFLEIPSSGGRTAPPERHLLVDGLTVTTGRHRIRYVSAHPGDATPPPVAGPEADLLGPEFDLPSGRIDALGREDAEDPKAS